MRCPYCGGLDTQVKDSRPTENSSSIRRRRICPDCGGRFTTFERVQLRELHGGQEERPPRAFDRDKLMRSVQVALRKRSVEPERVERMINGIVRQLESQSDGDIPTDRIGELVMEGLKALDDIAYVRFASVYRNFREARDFNAIVGELEAEPEPEPARQGSAPPAPERARDMSESAAADPHEDLRWMEAALNLGSRSLGLAAPNPAVGAILVKDGAVVGRGATAPGGRPHAERIAIAAGWRSGARRDALCDARALLAFRRLAALRRRNHRGRRRARRLGDGGSQSAGRRRGHARLRAAGIAVSVGAGADQARRDHLGHILRVTAGRPCVTLKLAETADGFASAGANDARLRITGPIADLRVQVMRSTHEAIMVGVGTALGDDPALTVRLAGARSQAAARRPRHPSAPARSARDSPQRPGDVPTLVIAGETAPEEAARRLEDLGVTIERAPLDAEGHVDLGHGLAGAQRPRDHARVQRRRTAGRLPAHCAWPRRRGRAHYGRQAARPTRRRRARPEARAALLDGSRYRAAETLDYGPDTMRLWRGAEG